MKIFFRQALRIVKGGVCMCVLASLSSPATLLVISSPFTYSCVSPSSPFLLYPIPVLSCPRYASACHAHTPCFILVLTRSCTSADLATSSLPRPFSPPPLTDLVLAQPWSAKPLPLAVPPHRWDPGAGLEQDVMGEMGRVVTCRAPGGVRVSGLVMIN